ncbi:MAG: flagellar biosynthetic protein FliO [Blautia sp.]|nr:flagellar biosynthetic protein FliO [Blautia sp.]MCM1201180.1 flagellar biosynthetic protein FliO [Bacteroides fragilis]
MILTVSNSANSYLQFLTVLILFVFVLAVTYFTTKWISGYQKGKRADANLEVIETFQIANSKYVQIIRVGQKYLAVAIGKDSVTMLTEVPEDQLTFSSSADNEQLGFRELFEKIQKKTILEKEEDRNKNE